MKLFTSSRAASKICEISIGALWQPRQRLPSMWMVRMSQSDPPTT